MKRFFVLSLGLILAACGRPNHASFGGGHHATGSSGPHAKAAASAPAEPVDDEHQDSATQSAPPRAASAAAGGYGGSEPSSKLSAGVVDVRGGLEANTVRRAVLQQQPRIQRCYEDARRTDGMLEGKVVVEAIVAESGSVTTVRDQGSTIGNLGVVDCVVRAVKGVQFPSSSSTTTFVFPFEFHP